MKRSLGFFVLILCAMTNLVYAQQAVSLDDAIKSGAQDIENKLVKGVKVVVLNFKAPTERFSNYVLDELMTVLVNNGKITVVDRQNLSLIQQEMNFQMSGEVSDASAQEIGMKLGAQSIISGSLEDMGNSYRLRFRTIEVVSAAIQVLSSANVRKDNQVATLMSGAPTSPAGRGNTSATQYPHGLNYSTGRKVGAGFLNWIYGLGSFTMGDWAGGLIVGGTGLVGVVLMASGAGEGVILEVASVIYGHIRPFQYDKARAKKNGTYYASENPIDHIHIALIPDNNGVRAVNLSYSLQF
ncbi:CsgG/HfaB family protein [Treponema primitia]|uniref:CsgG/HfaB family protein n=1 Tax=Treponema primitia TaxID=88058 RepID=UPI003980AE52